MTPDSEKKKEAMSYEEFQQLARLYTIGALDKEELEAFTAGRKLYGARAEAFIDECQCLNAILALSLLPMSPSAGLKERLMAKIREEAGEQAPLWEPTSSQRALATLGSDENQRIFGVN